MIDTEPESIREGLFRIAVELTEKYKGGLRNEEIGDKYTCTYGCPVNEQGYGICSKMMQILYGDMQAVRSGGDLTLVGGTEANVKDYVCPDGCVCFRMTAEKTGAVNFHEGKFYQEERENGV